MQMASWSARAEVSFLSTLASLSADAYAPIPVGGDGYLPFGNQHDFADGLSVRTYYNGEDFVMAIRGTEVDPSLNVGFAGVRANLAADRSFLSGADITPLSNYVHEAATVLSDLRAGLPADASISLTGHSLGGAVTDILAGASGVNGYGFDVPGVGQIYGQFDRLFTGDAENPYGQFAVSNFRLYGDQVSLIGTPFGQNFTVGTAAELPVVDLLTGNATAAIADAHSIIRLADFLNDHVSTKGLYGPDLTGPIEDIVVPAFPSIINNETVLDVASDVIALKTYFFDPKQTTEVEFLLNNGSPSFQALELPSFDGLDHYELSVLTGSSWSDFFEVAPHANLQFADGVDGIRFYALDALGGRFLLPGDFLFGASFRTDGIIEGTLALTAPTGVPEPASWFLLTAGFFLSGTSLRNGRKSSRQRSPSRAS